IERDIGHLRRNGRFLWGNVKRELDRAVASRPQNIMAQRISSLTPIGDVLARVAALARPVAPREMAVADAEGRLLAEDVRVTSPWPAVPVALLDGWAVRAETVADAGPYAPMPLSVAPTWVNAGEELPRDADAILPPDAVTESARGAEVHASVTAG